MSMLKEYLNVFCHDIREEGDCLRVYYNHHLVLKVNEKEGTFVLTALMLNRDIIDIYNNFFESIRWLHALSYLGKFDGVVYTEGNYRFPYKYIQRKEIRFIPKSEASES